MDYPDDGQRIEWRPKGTREWREATAAFVWLAEDVPAVALVGGGNFFPEFGDEWRPMEKQLLLHSPMEAPMSNIHDFPSYPIDLPCDVEESVMEPLAYGHPLHPANRGGYQAIEPEPYRFRLTPFWKVFGVCAILAVAIGAIWAAVR